MRQVHAADAGAGTVSSVRRKEGWVTTPADDLGDFLDSLNRKRERRNMSHFEEDTLRKSDARPDTIYTCPYCGGKGDLDWMANEHWRCAAEAVGDAEKWI